MKTNVAIPSFHRSKRTNPLANLHFNTTALEAWFEARKAIMTAKMGGMKTRKAAAREEAEFEKMKEKSRKEYEKNVEKWRSWPNGKKKASFTITEESEEAEQLARVRLAFLPPKIYLHQLVSKCNQARHQFLAKLVHKLRQVFAIAASLVVILLVVIAESNTAACPGLKGFFGESDSGF